MLGETEKSSDVCRTASLSEMSDCQKSNMAAAAMLNLLPVYFLTHFEDYGGKMCLHTKYHANRTIFGEVITFYKFSRWRPARSRDITICDSGPHTKSPRCSELAVQI